MIAVDIYILVTFLLCVQVTKSVVGAGYIHTLYYGVTLYDSYDQIRTL